VRIIFFDVLILLKLNRHFVKVGLKANSVIAAAIFHGSFNATAGLAVMVLKGGNNLLIGVTGLAGFIILLIANFGLFIYDNFLTKESLIMEVRS
jgi:hypothetical protein